MNNKLKKFTTAIAFSMIATLNITYTAPLYCVNAASSTSVGQSKESVESLYKLDSTKNIQSIGATSYVYTHIKSGAKILFLKNEDKNKFFSISFKTPATDNTGVNHIIEHSVLCGSAKYPVKSPLNEMSKQSLSTFLNAFTTSDMTMYPVGSKNDTDFKHLVDIYLDAVFAPNMLKEPNIFNQEGWHYELNSPTDELKANGTVYNEMNGHESEEGSILESDTLKTLFPDTNYKWNSGGNPADIITLNRNELINTYKKNYSPSNSYIVFYGNVNIQDTLKYMDSNYLSKFTKQKDVPVLGTQKPFTKTKTVEDYYGITNDDTEKDKTYISFNYKLTNILDKENMVAFQFLNNLLFGSESAPLQKAFIDNGFNLVGSSVDNSTYQPVFKISVINTEANKLDKIKNIIDSTLKGIVKNGFNQKYFTQCFNKYELEKRQSVFKSETVGLDYAQSVMTSWLYGGDPNLYLSTDDALAKIKKESSNSSNKYFENLINKYILNNTNSAIIVLKPKKGLQQEKDNETKNKLQKYKNSLSKAQVQKLIDDTKALLKWKNTPDSKEALSTIPSLSLKDLDIHFTQTPTKTETLNGVKLMYHPIPANSIANANFYFDFSRLPQNKYKYLSLLSSLMGNIGTKNDDYLSLSDKLNTYADGSVLFIPAIGNKFKHPDNFMFLLESGVICLDENIKPAMNTFSEIVNSTTFQDTKRIKQLLDQSVSALELTYKSSGGIITSSMMNSNLSDASILENELGGVKIYNFYKDLDNNFDKEWPQVKKEIEQVEKIVFNKNNLTLSFTGDEKAYKGFKSTLNDFTSKLNTTKYPAQMHILKTPEKNQAVVTPEKIVAILKGGSFKKTPYKYDPKMAVMAKILNSYLWDKVRVNGGAYGAEFSVGEDGILFDSHEDPNMTQTLKTFDSCVDYLKNFKATKQEMENYIIGSVGNANNDTWDPLTRGSLADSMILTGEPEGELEKEYKSMLSTTDTDIRGYAKVLKALLDQNCYFVSGNETIIKSDAKLFTSIKTISQILGEK